MDNLPLIKNENFSFSFDWSACGRTLQEAEELPPIINVTEDLVDDDVYITDDETATGLPDMFVVFQMDNGNYKHYLLHHIISKKQYGLLYNSLEDKQLPQKTIEP